MTLGPWDLDFKGFGVSRLRVKSLGFRVQDFGFRVKSLGFKVSGPRFRVKSLLFRVSASGLGFRVSGSCLGYGLCESRLTP